MVSVENVDSNSFNLSRVAINKNNFSFSWNLSSTIKKQENVKEIPI